MLECYIKNELDFLMDIVIKQTKNFIVFMEKNLTREGVQFKCTISVKPKKKSSIAPRRLQVMTVPAIEFKGFRSMLHDMTRNKSKQLKRYLAMS